MGTCKWGSVYKAQENCQPGGGNNPKLWTQWDWQAKFISLRWISPLVGEDQLRLAGLQELQHTEVMGHRAFFVKQPATEQGWHFFLLGQMGFFWGFGSFMSEIVSLRSQGGTGYFWRSSYFWRKVQLFLDPWPLVEGERVRWRQQLQRLPTELHPPED